MNEIAYVIDGTNNIVRIGKCYEKYFNLSIVVRNENVTCNNVKSIINSYDFDKLILSLYIDVSLIKGKIKDCFFEFNENIIPKLSNVERMEFLIHCTTDIDCVILMLQKMKYVTSLCIKFYCYDDISKQLIKLCNEIIKHENYLFVTLQAWIIHDEYKVHVKHICCNLLSEMFIAPLIFINYDFSWSMEIQDIGRNEVEKKNLLFIFSQVINYGFLFYINNFI